LEIDEYSKRIFARMAMLPEWMQSILLEDINDAIENRIRTMELIIQANKESQTPFENK
jgi:hypothetical protein